MQLHTGGKDMGKQRQTLNLNKNNKRELDQRDKSKVATKIAKQSTNQKYKVQIKSKVQIKRQNAKLKSKNTYHGELGTDRSRRMNGSMVADRGKQ